jgi:hypothetical protein
MEGRLMRPLNLQEFAEDLRVSAPDFRTADFADEILELVELEKEVAEPYSELCVDLDNYAPKALEGKPAKAVEWLGDRSNLLEEIEKLLEDAGRKGDVDDVVKAMLEELTPDEPEYDL